MIDGCLTNKFEKRTKMPSLWRFPTHSFVTLWNDTSSSPPLQQNKQRHPQEGGTTELRISQNESKTDSLLTPSSLYGMTLLAHRHYPQTNNVILKREARPSWGSLKTSRKQIPYSLLRRSME